MKNVTISLPDALAAAVRVDAAKAGKSMSRYIADMLDKETNLHARQIAAIEKFLSMPKFPISDENGRLPPREELYRRDLLRGREHPDLRDGQEQPAEVARGESSASGDRSKAAAQPESTGSE